MLLSHTAGLVVADAPFLFAVTVQGPADRLMDEQMIINRKMINKQRQPPLTTATPSSLLIDGWLAEPCHAS